MRYGCTVNPSRTTSLKKSFTAAEAHQLKIWVNIRKIVVILSLQESMQLSKRVKDNQSHISIAMQVEFVTIGGRTMLQPVINMVRYDGTLVSDISSNPAAAFAN